MIQPVVDQLLGGTCPECSFKRIAGKMLCEFGGVLHDIYGIGQPVDTEGILCPALRSVELIGDPVLCAAELIGDPFLCIAELICDPVLCAAELIVDPVLCRTDLIVDPVLCAADLIVHPLFSLFVGILCPLVSIAECIFRPAFRVAECSVEPILCLIVGIGHEVNRVIHNLSEIRLFKGIPNLTECILCDTGKLVFYNSKRTASQAAEPIIQNAVPVFVIVREESGELTVIVDHVIDRISGDLAGHT